MNCSSERLLNLIENGEVDFDADIAGPGVLAAFLTTSSIALMTLVVAFATFSVPLQLLNTGDAVMAKGVRSLFSRISNKLSKKLSRTEGTEGRAERIDAFMAFMVSISDQILVSQVAILLAAFIGNSEITIYSVNIIIALGCLASTVHLGSFPFYIDRLRDHSTAKLIRVITMVAGSGMLIYLLVIQLSSTWDMETHVYLTCATRDYRISGDDILGLLMSLFVPLTILYGTFEIIQFLYRSRPLEGNEPPYQARQGQRISGSSEERVANISQQRTANQDIELQQPQQPSSSATRLLEDQHGRESSRRRYQNHNTAIDIEDMLHWIFEDSTQQSTASGEVGARHVSGLSPRDIFKEITPSKRDNLLNKWLQVKAFTFLTSNHKSKRRLNCQIRVVAGTWAFHQCRGSFVWRILWLWSGNVYGIVTVFTARVYTTGMSGDRDKMGFGQIVPLALLALPLFAAMESNADYKERLKSLSNDRQETLTNAAHERREAPAPVEEVCLSTASRTSPSPDTMEGLSSGSPERLRFSLELLRERSVDMGHPYLYDWLKGRKLEDSSGLRTSVGGHAGFMFVLTTLLGWSMAWGESGVNVTLITILLLLTVCRATGLVKIARDTRPYLQLLDSIEKEVPQAGNHAEQTAKAHAAEVGQDIQENGDEENGDG